MATSSLRGDALAELLATGSVSASTAALSGSAAVAAALGSGSGAGVSSGGVAAAVAAAAAACGGGGGTAATATAAAAVAARLAKAREVERRHEIVSLCGDRLVVNTPNYERFRAATDGASPTMVLSFLGDTAVGKSTTITALMGAGADDKPHVQRAADQRASTTFNVNLYPSTAVLAGMTVNFLDYEGESGSSMPAMSGAATASAGGTPSAALRSAPAAGSPRDACSPGAATSGSLAARLTPGLAALAGMPLGMGVGGGGRNENLPPASSFATLTAAALAPSLAAAPSTSILERARLIRDHFPRLAYCVSDIVVLIGTDKLFSSRYLERALAFAKQANTNIQDVELPVLLVINNKIDVDECELNFEVTTRAFQEHMGRDLAQLDAYFSCIVVCQLPNTKTTAVAEDGNMLLGSELFGEQVGKIRTLISSLLSSRLVEREHRLATAGGPGRRIITSRQGLWYAMLPRIVAKLNTGEAVHVTRLIDEAWAATVAAATGRDAPMDVFQAFLTHMRPAPTLSATAPRLHEDALARFAGFAAAAMDVAAHLVAARLRAVDPALRFEDKMEAGARGQLEGVAALLADIAPCRAVYGDGHRGAAIELGTPTERAGEPLLCMQERRVHTKSHRGARTVRGGGPTLWQRMLAVLPYNPVWAGEYCAAHTPAVDVPALVADVLAAVAEPPAAFLHRLADLADAHSSASVAITFAPLDATAAAAVPPHTLAPAAAAAAGGLRVRLRAAPLDAALMPYCVGCCRKRAAPGAGGGSAGEAAPVDGSGGGTGVEGDDSYMAWTAAFLSDFLSRAGAEAMHAMGVTGSAAPRSGGGGGGVTFADAGATAAARGAGGGGRRGGLRPAATTGGVAVAVQSVVFGLCGPCLRVVVESGGAGAPL